MPPDDDRSRSASPARDPKPKKQKLSGFKWKEKRPRDEEPSSYSRDSGRLERGYRDRSPRRESRRDDRRDREGPRGRDGPRERGNGDRSPKRGSDSYRPGRDRGGDDELRREDRDNEGWRGDAAQENLAKPDKKEKKEKKEKKAKAPVSNEPMIVVNVNDRLGTKAAIPCLASDSVKAFKAMVAAHIGRQPHEILLKRQGERPFKDQLSLEDYGVSNGVQLDLELDTGD